MRFSAVRFSFHRRGLGQGADKVMPSHLLRGYVEVDVGAPLVELGHFRAMPHPVTVEDGGQRCRRGFVRLDERDV